MKNIVIDLNILLDFYENDRREKFPQSVAVFDCLKHNSCAYISSSSIDNFEFIKFHLVRQNYPELSKNAVLRIVHEMIREFLSFFKIAKTPSYLDIDFDDIEDTLIIASARAIDAKVLTRDEGMLTKYPHNTISPTEFLKQHSTQNSVSFLELKTINQQYTNQFEQAYDQVLNSGWLILGKQTQLFETEFASYCGTSHCIGVANGLEALHLVLKAWGIGTGDEVIVPSNTYIATWLAVSQVGATPVPVEPDLRTYNIDPDKIESAITEHARAIIPVHLYGQTADMDAIMELADRYRIKVLEDSAQGHGAMLHNQRAGSLGHASAFSFYPGKNLGALGDGGAVTTNDTELADKIRVLRNYGSQIKYKNEVRGYNSRLDELQSAFLRKKLIHLDRDNARRKVIAERYLDKLSSLEQITLPYVADGHDHVWHLFVIRTAKRDFLQKRLSELGVGTMIHYPIPPHLQQAYVDLGLSEGALPISELIHQQVLSLPMGPTQTIEDTDRVIAAVHQALSECE